MYGGQGSYNQGYSNQGYGNQGYGNQGGYGGNQGQNYNNYPNKGGYNYNQGHSGGGSDCAGDCCKACAAALCCCCLCDILTWSCNLRIFHRFFNFKLFMISYFKTKVLACIKIHLQQNQTIKTPSSFFSTKKTYSFVKVQNKKKKFHNHKLTQ